MVFSLIPMILESYYGYNFKSTSSLPSQGVDVCGYAGCQVEEYTLDPNYTEPRRHHRWARFQADLATDAGHPSISLCDLKKLIFMTHSGAPLRQGLYIVHGSGVVVRF